MQGVKSNQLALFELAPIKTRCRNCQHRQRWQMGLTVISYCGIKPSNRTDNKLKKIKAADPGCIRFETIIKSKVKK